MSFHQFAKHFTRQLSQLCLWSISLGCLPQLLPAAHITAGEITYQCLDSATNQYLVELALYLDCGSGLTLGTNQVLRYRSSSCGVPEQLRTLPLVDSTEVSPVCPGAGLTTCQGGTLLGIREYRYADTITLTQLCPDWLFTYRLAYRNVNYTNLTLGVSSFFYLETRLNNTLGCNNSPEFLESPLLFPEQSQPFAQSLGGCDPDGDSLAFEQINPLDFDLGTNQPFPISYDPPFLPTYPLVTIPPIVGYDFNTQTGYLQLTAPNLERSIVTIRVLEYRNGILVGSTIRDMNVTVLGAFPSVSVEVAPSLSCTTPISPDPSCATFWQACGSGGTTLSACLDIISGYDPAYVYEWELTHLGTVTLDTTVGQPFLPYVFQPGLTEFTVTALDTALGCSDSFGGTIFFPPTPALDLIPCTAPVGCPWTPPDVCEGDTVYFQLNNTPVDIATFDTITLDWGDAVVDTLYRDELLFPLTGYPDVFQHVYIPTADTGYVCVPAMAIISYQIQATGRSTCGLSTDSSQVTVHLQPSPSLSVSTSTTCTPEVCFDMSICPDPSVYISNPADTIRIWFKPDLSYPDSIAIPYPLPPSFCWDYDSISGSGGASGPGLYQALLWTEVGCGRKYDTVSVTYLEGPIIDSLSTSCVQDSSGQLDGTFDVWVTFSGPGMDFFLVNDQNNDTLTATIPGTIFLGNFVSASAITVSVFSVSPSGDTCSDIQGPITATCTSLSPCVVPLIQIDSVYCLNPPNQDWRFEATILDGDTLPHLLAIASYQNGPMMVQDTFQTGLAKDSTFSFDVPVDSPVTLIVRDTSLTGGTLCDTTIVIATPACMTTAIRENRQESYGNLLIPNAFMPGSNVLDHDVFQPVGFGLQAYHVAVYDEQGVLLWESTALENGRPLEGWDGTVGGQVARPGVYMWRIHQATFQNGQEWPGMRYPGQRTPRRYGTVSLIR